MRGDEHVLGREADLARVGEAAPEEPARGQSDVDAGVHDHGVLASELERDGCQVLRCGGGDDAGNASVADVHNWNEL